MRTEREVVLRRLADAICGQELGHVCRVAIDGITASGKSTLAAELVAEIGSLNRPATRLSMDGYHHRREHRYQQGCSSPAGYYEDAFDFDAFARQVLLPLGAGGNSRYRDRILDLASDTPVQEEPIELAAEAVLVVDGTFLARPELRPHRDFRVFVRTSFANAEGRGVARDAHGHGGVTAARAIYRQRYHPACQLYLEDCHPEDTADAIVDNNHPDRPQLKLK